tara:strand:+ start:18519 stop:19385 length:867 start_codon:yes stop_codon:yes gene_type:complete
MNNSLTLNNALPTGSIEAYVNAAFQLPMLTEAQEYRLAKKLRDYQDIDAAKQLVMAHLRFVIRVAKGFDGYGLPQQDLIQEGTVGLMKAVRRFDPDKGVRLVSFAVHWIKAEIHEYILRNWKIVKIATTKAQRKLFFNLRSSKKRLGWFSREEIQGVAEDLGVKPETVVEMEARISNQDLAYDLSEYEDENDDFKSSPSTYLYKKSDDPINELELADTKSFKESSLYSALSRLDKRSQEVLKRRWLSEDKATLQALAKDLGVSAERIRQIEKAAMTKIKEALGNSLTA